jgi:putative effector of murein hydrolase
MAAEERIEAQSTFSKVILYATVISGFVAAYLMYRRGESMVSIARKTVTNPVGSQVSEVKNVV